MFLELAKFVSLLFSILSLDAVFHAAFMGPSSDLAQRLAPALRLLLLAAAVCLASGYIFHAWDQKMEQKWGTRQPSLAGTFPMQIFWWASGVMALLFAISWFLQDYYLPLQAGEWRGAAL